MDRAWCEDYLRGRCNRGAATDGGTCWYLHLEQAAVDKLKEVRNAKGEGKGKKGKPNAKGKAKAGPALKFEEVPQHEPKPEEATVAPALRLVSPAVCCAPWRQVTPAYTMPEAEDGWQPWHPRKQQRSISAKAAHARTAVPTLQMNA